MIPISGAHRARSGRYWSEMSSSPAALAPIRYQQFKYLLPSKGMGARVLENKELSSLRNNPSGGWREIQYPTDPSELFQDARERDGLTVRNGCWTFGISIDDIRRQ